MKKNIKIKLEEKHYSCDIESIDDQNLKVELSENDSLKFNGNLNLKDIYAQLKEFSNYSIEDIFSVLDDLVGENFNIIKESDKYKLDISIKVIKKIKHLFINSCN